MSIALKTLARGSSGVDDSSAVPPGLPGREGGNEPGAPPPNCAGRVPFQETRGLRIGAAQGSLARADGRHGRLPVRRPRGMT